MRVLCDTNTLISAAIAKGKPRKLLLKALANEFVLIASNELLGELEEVITKPKFKLSSFEKSKSVAAVRKTAEIVKVQSDFKVIKEDPDDNMILNTAYDGKVDYIVTGDSDLLKLEEFEGINIVSANGMLKILESK